LDLGFENLEYTSPVIMAKVNNPLKASIPDIILAP